ncbi:MAG: hypothetical protein E3J58_00040 [Actinomycetota bacterium]|nr:MAG: hypothetical protein E3J58_00040 [Actinomycetota bacterium]
MKRIKTIIILIFAVMLTAFYTTGCFPGGLDLFSSGMEGIQENTIAAQSSSEEEDARDDIDTRLNELKKGLVSAPVVLSHVSGEQIFGSGDRELIFLKGSAEAGNTVEIYVNGTLDQDGIEVDSNGIFETLNGVDIIEGKNIVELIAVNPSGRKSGPTKFSLELVVPQKVEYTLYNNSTDLVEIDGVYYTTESKPGVYLRGTYIPGSSIFIQANDRIVGEVVSSDTGIFTLSDIQLDTGDNEVAVWAITTDGYISAPIFESIAVFKDMITPYPSNLTGYQNGNVNYISWNTSIDDNFSTYKIVRVEDPCINPEYPDNDVIATISDQNTISYIDDDVEEGRSYYYTVWTLDRAGHVVSSNVLAIPKPVYTISISKVEAFTDISVNRREWFYQYYEITNTGNVTLDLQPIMIGIKLSPEPEVDMEITPLWEVHIWNPDDSSKYYYSNESIYESYISDWVNTYGHTTTEEETTYSSDGLTKTVTITETTKNTEKNGVNLKRIMTVTTVTTVTDTDLTTGIDTVTIATDTTTEIVEPEKIGSLIEDLDPGEKIKIGVKIQNISAANNEEIVVHFHFAPVDCAGYFFIDEIVSTGDIYCKSSGRN